MFNWFKNRRRQRLLAERFPSDWLEILSRNVPYYAWLSSAKQQQLRDDLRLFIAERQWVGCAGLEVTDEMRVTIAAQACLLPLGIQPTYHYERIKSVLVYPGPYRHPPRKWNHSAGGIVSEGQVILGEAWHRSPIVLSWQSVLDGIADPHDGDNVVFHEFAHHLDGLDGDVDGTPPLESREQYLAWDAVVPVEYNRLVQAVRAGAPSFLREYGATNRAEFFAVATENFFERGPEMLHELPQLYGVLRGFYRQDTAKWPAGPPRERHLANRVRPSREFALRRSTPTESEETRSLLKVIHIKPGSADAYFSLGVAYLNDHRDEEAEAALSEAVRLNPTDEETLLQRGIVPRAAASIRRGESRSGCRARNRSGRHRSVSSPCRSAAAIRDDAGALEDCESAAGISPRSDGILRARHGAVPAAIIRRRFAV